MSYFFSFLIVDVILLQYCYYNFIDVERLKDHPSVPILHSHTHVPNTNLNEENFKLTNHISPPKADTKPVRKETVNSKLQNKLYK